MVVSIQVRAANCMLCHWENYAAKISGWVMLDRTHSLEMNGFL